MFQSKLLPDGEKVISTRAGSKVGSRKSKALEMVQPPSVTATFYAGEPHGGSDAQAGESQKNLKTEQTLDNRMGCTSRVDSKGVPNIEALRHTF